MKKVLVILSQSEGNGGIPRFNRNLVCAFKEEENIDARLLSLNDSGKDGAGRNKLKFISHICKTIISYRPDYIIIGLLNFIPLAILRFLSLRKSKVITILHGIEAWEARNNLMPFYRFGDEFWAVSHYTKRQFSQSNHVSSDRVIRIFNTIPDIWLEDKKDLKRKKFFFTVTRLDESEGYKGVEYTLNALASIKEDLRAANWKYIVVASGSDLERHKRIVLDKGITDLVEFRSNVSDEELMELYQNCSFFILPSTGEGFGIVFLEAMAFRKACIGCLGCGTEDVIENQKTGYLLEQNEEEIKYAVFSLIEDEKKCKEMGERGYVKLCDEFVFSCFKNKIVSLLLR